MVRAVLGNIRDALLINVNQPSVLLEETIHPRTWSVKIHTPVVWEYPSHLIYTQIQIMKSDLLHELRYAYANILHMVHI